jgi:outer membrane protein assembly factor BamA
VLLGALVAHRADGQNLKRVVEQPKLATLKFTGNVNISTATLRAAIRTRATHSRKLLGIPTYFWKKAEFLDRAELDRDLLRIRVMFWKRGWRAAQVTPLLTKRSEGVVDLTLQIVEGPPTLIGTLNLGALDSLLDRHDLRPLVTVRRLQPLDLIQLDSIAVRITAHLDVEGYGDVIVTPTVRWRP